MAKISLRERFLSVPRFSFARRGVSATQNSIKKRPIISFVIALLLLLAVIALGNFLFKPPAEEQAQAAPPKQVKVFTIGATPIVSTQAQIHASGVITIMAQSPGIVQKLQVTEGTEVSKGTNLINLSSNYAGANAPAVQQGIAAKQLQLTNETFDSQKEIIAKSREVAIKSEENTTALRDISARSIVDLRAIVDSNSGMLRTIQANLRQLEALPTDPATEQQILQLRQIENQLQAGQNQTVQGLLNVEHQANPSNPPTQLAALQKEIALKQLDIQEKTLQSSKDIARLQVALASINTSLLHPTAPFSARVEKVLVREGEAVNPGTPLLMLSGTKQDITVVAKVPSTLARQISQVEDSTLYLNGVGVSTVPSFVSDIATDGLLYSVIYQIPDGYKTNLTDSDFVTVDIPVGVADKTSTPFVPLDSIFQTQEKSYLYVNENGTVKSKTVTIGDVLGSYAQILNGLSNGEQVILSRNVLEGDKVQVTP